MSEIYRTWCCTVISRYRKSFRIVLFRISYYSRGNYSAFCELCLGFLRRFDVLFALVSFLGPRVFSVVLFLGASEMFVRQVANLSTKFGSAIAKTSKGSWGSLDFARAFWAVAKSSREVWELLQRDSYSVGPCAL